MNLQNYIKNIINEWLNENKFNNTNYLKDVLNKLNIENYKILGKGQHGIVISFSDKCLKLTDSNNEITLIKKIYNNIFNTLPKVHDYGTVNNIFYYIRDCYVPINEVLAEKIGENLEEIADFFAERKNFNVKKSNTNLNYEFDDKFLNFLTNLKKDINKLNRLPYNWDIDGLPLNVFTDNNNNYILADF